MTTHRLRAMQSALLELDHNLFARVRGRRKERLNRSMTYITHVGDPLGWLGLTLGLALSGPRGRRVVRDAAPSSLMAVGTSYLLKVSFGRPRPRVGIDNLEALVRDPDRYSFPSAHAASSTALAVRTLATHPQAGVPLVLLAALISFSRIYVGVHYPLDVVAGMALGTATALSEPLWATVLRANAQSTVQAVRGLRERMHAVNEGKPSA